MNSAEHPQNPDEFAIIDQAKQQLSEATGLKTETVSELRFDDPYWCVVVEMLELARVPSTTDVLGSYSVRLDEHGHMVQYHRLRRYVRSQVLECV